MTDEKKTRTELLAELKSLRQRIARLEKTQERLETAEEKLRESEERYRALFAAVTDAVFVHHIAEDGGPGDIIEVNEAACRMLGFSRDELLRMSVKDIDAPESEVDVKRVVDELKTGRDVIFEQIQKAKDGTRIPVEVHGKAFNYQGHPALLATVRDIGDRKKMEEALRWEKGLFERIAEMSPVGITMVDRAGRITFANRMAVQVLGFTPEEVLSRRFNGAEWKITDFEGNPFPEEQLPFTRVYKSGKPVYGVQHAIEKPDGKRVLLMINAAPLFSEISKFEGMVATVEDVTAEVEAVERLADSEFRYREIFENMSDGVVIYEAVDGGRDFIIRGFNRAAERIEKINRKDILGRRVTEVFPGVGEFGILDAFSRVGGSGLPEYHPVGFYRDGRIEGWRKNYICRLPSNEVVAIYSDETERMRQEEAIRESERELKIRNQIQAIFLSRPGPGMYQAALDVMLDAFESPLGVFGYLDGKGDLVLASLTPKAWEECRVEGKSNVFPQSSWGGIWGRALLGKELVFSNSPLQPPEGHVPIFRALACPILHHGETIGIITLANSPRDYTNHDRRLLRALCDKLGLLLHDRLELERRETERKKLEAQIQHAQKLESLGVLAGGIAHDFNNLLMGILGNASLALMELPPGSSARQTLESIETAGMRAAELTRQLLAYSGKGRFVVEPINLNLLVEEMVNLLQLSISKKAVLRFNLAPELPAIMADSGQIRQIVMNLITNASEAIGDKSGLIAVTTGVIAADHQYLKETYLDDSLSEGNYVYLEISDNGSGMDEATRAKIFDPFFTTKFTGRGLGLAAVLGIVRGHKGAIKVYSELKKGTTFKVLFPSTDQTAAGPFARDGGDDDLPPGLCILVADDEETVRNVARIALERAGARVFLAEDGRRAVEIFQERAAEINLVILDMTMPHLGGEDVFRELRRKKPGVKVILSSGYNEQDATNRFAGKGLAGFLQKPYRPRDLYQKIRDVIGKPENQK